MELSLNLGTLNPPHIRNISRILRSSTDIIFKRSTDFIYISTLFPIPQPLNKVHDSWVILLYDLRKLLILADSPLPPEMSGEIQASVVAVEAGAEFLRRETELNGTRVHFRSPDDEIGGGGGEDPDGMSG